MKNTNVHRMALQSRELLNAPETKAPSYSNWQASFIPRREARVMADEAQKTAGLFIPYPLLGLILTLTLALGAGIVGLYATVQTLNTTLLIRDSDYQRQLKEQKEKMDQLEIYLHNDRERLIALERESQSQSKRRN